MLFHSLEAVGRAVMLAAEVQEANSEEREDQAAFSVDQPLAEPQEPHSEAMEAGGPWAAARATRAEAAAMDFIVWLCVRVRGVIWCVVYVDASRRRKEEAGNTGGYIKPSSARQTYFDYCAVLTVTPSATTRPRTIPRTPPLQRHVLRICCWRESAVRAMEAEAGYEAVHGFEGRGL